MATNVAISLRFCNTAAYSKEFDTIAAFITVVLSFLVSYAVCATGWAVMGIYNYKNEAFYALDIQTWPMKTALLTIYEAKCWFSRGHFTTLEYCHTFAHPIVFDRYWELSNEVLYKDFPQGASELPEDKILDF